jgi:hypothetical protein
MYIMQTNRFKHSELAFIKGKTDCTEYRRSAKKRDIEVLNGHSYFPPRIFEPVPFRNLPHSQVVSFVLNHQNESDSDKDDLRYFIYALICNNGHIGYYVSGYDYYSLAEFRNSRPEVRHMLKTNHSFLLSDVTDAELLIYVIRRFNISPCRLHVLFDRCVHFDQCYYIKEPRKFMKVKSLRSICIANICVYTAAINNVHLITATTTTATTATAATATTRIDLD